MVNEESGTGIDRTSIPSPMRGRDPRLLSGMVWLALGFVAGTMVPFFGVVMTAYGMREMVEAQGNKGFLLAAAVAAIVAVGSAVAAPAYAAMVATGTFASVAGTVWLMRTHRANVTGVSVLVVLLTLMNLGVEAGFAMMAGTTVSEVYQSMFGAMSDGVVGPPAAEFRLSLWLASSSRCLRRSGLSCTLSPLYLMFSLQPSARSLWVRAPLVWRGCRSLLVSTCPCGLLPSWRYLCLDSGASAAGFPGTQAVLTVSATVLLSVRIIFALQGFGVVLHPYRPLAPGMFSGAPR